MLMHALLGLMLGQSGTTPLPTSLAQDPPPAQEDDRKNEFAVNVNLWPILESTTLPTGERRTALWPLFHVTTLPKGGNHSWHVLNFFSGPNYHMLLPLYYSVDNDLGILPPLLLAGTDYWASVPLLSGRWRYSDGDQSTWITPLFHVTERATGELRSLHAGPYFQGEDWWAVPPLLSAGWDRDGGGRTTWITPLFHVATDRAGEVDSLHALLYFQDKTSWSLPPLFTWQKEFDSGEQATWVTPLFHWTRGKEGELVSAHAGPYIQGKDYWMFLPLAGSGRLDDDGRTTWITPFYHATEDKNGELRNFHIGPYVQGMDWWSVPPLLMAGWKDGSDRRMTLGGIFCLRTDKEGLASADLCPVFSWERDKSWCLYPLLSGRRFAQGSGQVTWITPAFHLTSDAGGEIEDFHVGPYFQGRNYWMVPPLLAWHWKYDDKVETTWLTPFFHLTLDKEGEAESAHVFPAWFWKRDDYWCAPPLLSSGWRSDDGHRTIWATPFFHRTEDSDGFLLDLHLGPYLQGRNYWGIPPLLTGGWTYPEGAATTWVTPLFHLTTDSDGEIDSLHLGPYFQGRNYWALPPLFSWHVRHPDDSATTWITPAFHLSTDSAGDVGSFHVLPAWFWERDSYWAAPPLLSAGWRQADGARTTWVTPLFHATTEPGGDLRSLHAAPVWFWERDSYWAIPPLLVGAGRHADGAQTTWITPIFHWTDDREGRLESFHTFPAFFWKRDDYWVAPFLLSGGFTRADRSSETWISPLYHAAYSPDGALRSRHVLNYFDGPAYHHVFPVFWDWKADDRSQHTMFAPPLFVRTEEKEGDVTTSLPWPLISWRSGRALDTSLGMELRPFLYQSAKDQYEFNFLWRLFSVLRDEESTRVMVGPLWHSDLPRKDDSMTKFQVLGGLFARDCNYETRRYRYRMLWVIPFESRSMGE